MNYISNISLLLIVVLAPTTPGVFGTHDPFDGEDGRTLYHGTTNNNTAPIRSQGFGASTSGRMGRGVYFTDDFQTALEISKNRRGPGKDGVVFAYYFTKDKIQKYNTGANCHPLWTNVTSKPFNEFLVDEKNVPKMNPLKRVCQSNGECNNSDPYHLRTFLHIRKDGKQKCMHGLGCTNPDKNHHENFFHPEGFRFPCEHGNKCGNQTCRYRHAKGWKPLCKYGLKCHNCDEDHGDSFYHGETWNPAYRPCHDGALCCNTDENHGRGFTHPPNWDPKTHFSSEYGKAKLAANTKEEKKEVNKTIFRQNENFLKDGKLHYWTENGTEVRRNLSQNEGEYFSITHDIQTDPSNKNEVNIDQIEIINKDTIDVAQKLKQQGLKPVVMNNDNKF